MDSALVIAVVVAALLGLLIGWLFAGRQAAALTAARDALAADRDEQLGRFKAAIVDLESESRRREAAELRLATLEAERGAQEAGLRGQIAQLKEAQAALTAQFREVGQTMLDNAQKAFLERAEARFKESEASAGQNLKALLSPVSETLKQYDEKLAQIEKARVGSYAELNRAISDLATSNDVVRKETARLANVMTASPKARGRWGEQQLKNILESAGLAENVDFELQTSVSDGDRQLRPDCVIHLPGERSIVVDVKCPLVHFDAAFEEEDEGRRKHLLGQHAGALRSYASDLGKKSYWQQFENSPDFVIMFIPGEHFLSAAAERAPELIETAFKNGVIIASTINMLALAKLMAGMWRQEKLMGEAKKIAALGKELHERLAKMSEHIVKVGRNLELATDAYDAFVGSLERNVLTSARRFEDYGIAADGKEIVELKSIGRKTKKLSKLTADVSESDAGKMDQGKG
jgi:DNA recombination protein RmuC